MPYRAMADPLLRPEDALARIAGPAAAAPDPYAPRGAGLDELGLEIPTLPSAPADTPYQSSGYGRLLEGLFNAMQGAQAPRTHNFGQGLVVGLARGFGSGGRRVARGRERFEARQEARRLAADEDRRKATTEYRKQRADELSKRGAETRAEARTTIEVTPAMRAKYPDIPEGFVGQKVPERTLGYYTKEAPKKVLTPAEEEELAFRKARGTRRGAPLAPKEPKQPSATERENLVNDAAALQQTDEIQKMFKKEFVGPYAGRAGAAAQTTGFGLKPGEADFRAALAIYRNKVINMLSGSAVSVGEQARMIQQIPNTEDPSQVFESKLRKTRRNIERVARERRKVYSQTGLDLSGLDALPAGEAETDQNANYVNTLGLGGP